MPPISPALVLTRLLPLAFIPLTLLPNLSQAQVTYYELYHGANFLQTTAAPPSATSYFAVHRLTPQSGTDLALATVTTPSGAIHTLEADDNGMFVWEDPNLATFAELEAVLSPGDYDYAVSGGLLGKQHGIIDTAGPRWPTAAPWVRNFNDLRTIVPNRAVAVDLDPWSSPNANWRATYAIVRSAAGIPVFASETPSDNPTITIPIPAGTLAPNTSYSITIEFRSQKFAHHAGFSGTATRIVAWNYVTISLLTTVADEPCPPDVNRDGFLDVFDYIDFVECFENNNCVDPVTADYNGDGFADFFDYSDFVTDFENGC